MKDTYTYRFGKLVRDETVPGYLDDETVISVDWRELNVMDYRRALVAKIHEEADEIPVLDEVTPEIIAEIADLVDVIEALKHSYGISDEAILSASQQKTARRGGFEDRHYIEEITVTPTSEWREYCVKDPARYPEVQDESDDSTFEHRAPTIKKGTYRHSKTNQLYEALGVAYHTETGEQMVIYRPLYVSGHELFGRSHSMFTEDIEIDGVRTPRFQSVEIEEECS